MLTSTVPATTPASTSKQTCPPDRLHTKENDECLSPTRVLASEAAPHTSASCSLRSRRSCTRTSASRRRRRRPSASARSLSA
ncbi:hypothetical protein ACFPRL_25235 [Pseudoclavibacter helvolus]